MQLCTRSNRRTRFKTEKSRRHHKSLGWKSGAAGTADPKDKERHYRHESTCYAKQPCFLWSGRERVRRPFSRGLQDSGEEFERDIQKQKFEIETAHQIGQKNQSSNARPLVAKFLRYQNKEFIRRWAHLLKGTRISIAEHFPTEIAERRKALYPVLKQARGGGHKAVLIKDPLIIDSQLCKS